MKNVKLIICDIDGTLYDWSMPTISDENKKMLKLLHEKGILLALGSGRSVPELITYAPEWGLDFQFDFLIGMNGGELYNTHTKQKNTYYPLKKEWTKEIIEFMKQYPANPFCHYEDKYMLYRDDNAMMERSLKSSKRIGKKVKSDADFYAQDNPKIMFRMSEELTLEVEKYINEHPFEHYNAFKTQSTLLEFADKRCSKGVALTGLCEMLNIDINEVVAYGDTTNDNEMLKVAGLGVCLLNGSDDTKACADEITEKHCNENGFAHHVQTRILPIIEKNAK